MRDFFSALLGGLAVFVLALWLVPFTLGCLARIAVIMFGVGWGLGG